MDLIALAEVQSIDTQIDQALHARPRLAAVVEHEVAEAELRTIRDRIAEMRKRQQQAQDELDRVERDSSDIDVHRDRLAKQMKTVIAPREAEALQHEMETLASRRSELDDRGLQLLESSAGLDGEITEACALEARAVERVGVSSEARRVAETDADAHIGKLRADRAAKATGIAPVDLAAYEKQRAAFGGVAIAAIVHGSCSGCHMGISKSELDVIKRSAADTVAECPSCARWLVR